MIETSDTRGFHTIFSEVGFLLYSIYELHSTLTPRQSRCLVGKSELSECAIGKSQIQTVWGKSTNAHYCGFQSVFEVKTFSLYFNSNNNKAVDGMLREAVKSLSLEILET